MQRADTKRRVRVAMCRGLLRCVTVFMRVDVDVAISVVLVFVRVNIVFKRATQRPQTDSEQHHADESFAPSGNPFHGNHVFQREQQHSHKRDARRVTQAPTRARQPSSARTTHRQRSHSRQMVRPSPDVNRPGDESCESGDDDG